jgi:integrase
MSEFWRQNREFYQPNLKSSPDKVFGTHRAAKVVDREGKPKYAIHTFRHYFASWCLNPESRGGLGMPPQDVQYLLGHSSIVMTLDVYGHLFPLNTNFGRSYYLEWAQSCRRSSLQLNRKELLLRHLVSLRRSQRSKSLCLN